MANYHLVTKSEPHTTFLQGNGEPMRFIDAEHAMSYARDLQIADDYKPRVEVTSDWIERETARFLSGEYRDTVWMFNLTPIPEHFAHVSVDAPEMIAYTASPEHGALDRQTRTTPNRYLTKFYPDLAPAAVEAWGERHKATFGQGEAIAWASTPEEIERVYSLEASFGSCMQYSADNFGRSGHPCRVYGAGDLSVAYLMRGTILHARALVWRAKGKVGRVYGDDSALRLALAGAGIITESNNSDYDELHGARLLRIEHNGRFVCPYIDRTGSVDDRGDYLIIGGGIDASDTSGLSSCVENEQGWCERCEDSCDEDEDDLRRVITSSGAQSWCPHCRENHTTYCDDGETYSDDDHDFVEVYRSEFRAGTYPDSNLPYGTFYCERSENYYRNNVGRVEMADGTTWCEYSFRDHGFKSEFDGLNYAIDERVETAGGSYVAESEVSDPDLWHCLPDGRFEFIGAGQGCFPFAAWVSVRPESVAA